MAECLRSALNNLKELNLSFDEINKEGALAIVEALASKDSLEKLELNGKVFSCKLELHLFSSSLIVSALCIAVTTYINNIFELNCKPCWCHKSPVAQYF